MLLLTSEIITFMAKKKNPKNNIGQEDLSFLNLDASKTAPNDRHF